ncbi:MAG: MgtC/SapB family protein [Proteiniphilum sp.]|nr:MgtC/SapB family protein [Proteiniphilum sp.]
MLVADFIIRVVVAALTGASVGLERQWNNKSAGLRTNTLVSLGACIFVITSVLTTQETGDPSRVIGQVVSGMGFLGAGVIFRHGLNVQGLTTAATLWCSASLGCMAGLGYYTFAVICAVLVIAINLSFKLTDKWIYHKRKHKKYEEEEHDEFE